MNVRHWIISGIFFLWNQINWICHTVTGKSFRRHVNSTIWHWAKRQMPRCSWIISNNKFYFSFLLSVSDIYEDQEATRSLMHQHTCWNNSTFKPSRALHRNVFICPCVDVLNDPRLVWLCSSSYCSPVQYSEANLGNWVLSFWCSFMGNCPIVWDDKVSFFPLENKKKYCIC